MKNRFYLLLALWAFSLPGCEMKDDIDVSIKRKAVVHLVYHYDNGTEQTLDALESMRLFIYDRAGRLYRDTTLTPEQFLCDTGAMQTYLSNGDYTIISWANVGARTSVIASALDQAELAIDPAGADPLLFGRCDSPVVKGDSLLFDVHLFKSVYRINVRVIGLEHTLSPQDHYFGITNRSALTIDNKPAGDLRRYRPLLQYRDDILAGFFYTPYFAPGDDFTVGVYNDNPLLPYTTLCQASIHDFWNYTKDAIGKDVEINVDIRIDHTGATIIVTDWLGQIIQNENLGS